jgi:TPR repeat protein
LSYAASNSADIEALALQAGMKKGGAAKGELTLAIFELANCFRNGWGVQKDPVAAKQYYETAANMGDTDAMNEAAWCYLEGFGCKKDKVSELPISIVPWTHSHLAEHLGVISQFSNACKNIQARSRSHRKNFDNESCIRDA